MRIMENKNTPEVDNLLNNEPTRINTVQIANAENQVELRIMN